MWVTPDGVAHTVVLPDPTSAMLDNFTASITSLSEDDRDALSLRMLELEDEIFALIENRNDAVPHAPDDEGLRDGYLEGRFESLSATTDYLGRIELRWQLDALAAVQELLNFLDEV